MIYTKKWEIELSTHAVMRAKQKGITADMIEATLKTGKIKRNHNFSQRCINCSMRNYCDKKIK